MDARIILLSPRRCRLDLLEGDLIRCLEQREDALATGRIDIVKSSARRLSTTDYMLGGVAS